MNQAGLAKGALDLLFILESGRKYQPEPPYMHIACSHRLFLSGIRFASQNGVGLFGSSLILFQRLATLAGT